ncbi:hypothetical protein B0H10DRAFT_1995540, partial [Mycena sp. CBHHK59/15]
MSEIDDIFAKRPVASTSVIVPSKKKRKEKQVPENNTTVALSKKRPAPETIVDPSVRAPPQKRANPINLLRRKTEEGWSIYKEDELGIGDEGGDTPLCPFDCNC